MATVALPGTAVLLTGASEGKVAVGASPETGVAPGSVVTNGGGSSKAGSLFPAKALHARETMNNIETKKSNGRFAFMSCSCFYHG
jgi:hypothetical protein